MKHIDAFVEYWQLWATVVGDFLRQLPRRYNVFARWTIMPFVGAVFLIAMLLAFVFVPVVTFTLSRIPHKT